MPRRKEYFKWEIPKTVVELVRGICGDYKRRENAIKYGNVTGAVLLRYIELNNAIESALQEIEIGVRQTLFEDFLRKKGFDFSTANGEIYKNGYYMRKRRFVYTVAKELNLLQ